jgi:hypothetical protein
VGALFWPNFSQKSLALQIKTAFAVTTFIFFDTNHENTRNILSASASSASALV